MRFLNITQNRGLALTKDLTTPPSPYTILSHAWGADEDEVTFDNLEKKSGQNKVGYTKLRFFAEQTRTDGLKYCWVVTYCFNKVNLIKLNEAMRSMFC
jgi:hypothetical protein